MAGVGHATEQRLWRNGYRSWNHLWEALNSGWSAADVLRDRFVQARLFEDIGPREKHKRTLAWLDCLDESRRSWKACEYRFFTELLRPSDHWRLLSSVIKDCLFLDIETTGLSSDLHYATVIGALYQNTFHQWVWPQPLDELRELLKSAKLLVTFNGRRFDVPFLQTHIPDLTFPAAHIDLLYIANAAAMKGGQKADEEKIGLTRDKGIRDLSGREAVLAWCSGLYGDQKALRQLLKYNRADVEMMPLLAMKLCGRLSATTADVLREPKTSITTRKKLGHKPSSFDSLNEAWQKHRPGLHLLEPKLLRRFGRLPKIVGIDLRGKPENPTGWALCEGSRAETYVLFQDDEIVSRTLAEKPDLVSIDAPLALPRGRKSASDDSPCRKEGGIVRDAERILWARGVGVYPALIPHMQKLTERGMRLATRLESLGVKVIESYPGAAQDVLGIPRKRANEDLLTRGLREFGHTFEDGKSHDELDAITSALVGYFYLADEYEAIGAEDECFMIIPKWNAMSWGNQTSPTVVSLIGLPGAGKSTLSRALAARLGWQNFALGDALRVRASSDGSLREILDDGKLAPEALVYELVHEAAQQPVISGLVIDGFPRHQFQVGEARRLFERPVFLFLDVNPELAIQRLSHRGQRPEDSSETARKRVQESKESLCAMLACLRHDCMIRLDAALPETSLVDAAVRELRSTRL
jgi:uncharacterized protein YprB with RNaseH-like and TPR domain/predicted nuclease with RNAse H fold/adenylate kinase family enzyme